MVRLPHAVIAVDTNGDECCKGSDRSILQPQVCVNPWHGSMAMVGVLGVLLLVIHAIIADIWVAFFQECEQ